MWNVDEGIQYLLRRGSFYNVALKQAIVSYLFVTHCMEDVRGMLDRAVLLGLVPV